jgi:hypothetical protein
MEDAASRRERLRALKQAAQLVESGGGDAAAVAAAPSAAQEAAAEQPAEKPLLKFRNYVVKDEKNIQHEKVRTSPVHPVRCTADAGALLPSTRRRVCCSGSFASQKVYGYLRVCLVCASLQQCVTCCVLLRAPAGSTSTTAANSRAGAGHQTRGGR